MASHVRGSGWISTSKASKSARHKSKAATPKLRQSSLHDFIEREQPKKILPQKENRNVNTISKSTKRKQDRARDGEEEGVARKKRRKTKDALQGRQHEPPVVDPLPPSQGLGDHLLSPILVSDSPDVVSWDDATVWDSATSSRTIRVEPIASTSCSLKEYIEVQKESSARTEETSAPFKVPAPPKALRRPQEHVLTPVTSNRSKLFGFDDDPFIATPRSNALKPLREMEVVPSSQPQELEYSSSAQSSNSNFVAPSSQDLDVHFAFPSLPSPSRIHQSLWVDSDEIIPSSQSQHLLPYRASPSRLSLHTNNGTDSVTQGAEIVPSSQILEEHELQVPVQCRAWSSTTDFMIPSEPLSMITNTSSLSEKSTRLSSTPPRPSASASFPIKSPTLSPLHNPPSPRQTETLSSAILSTSPPPMVSSQYSYLSEDASYPPEMKNFLQMLDDDRHSLGSEFFGSSLGQSLTASEAPGSNHDPSNSAPTGGKHSPDQPTTSSPESQLPLHDSSLPQESVSTQHIPIGCESQFTFVEESYPPVVTDFLDMIDQDRGSLGFEFQESI